MQEKAHIFKLSIKDEASIVENISKLYKPELEKISTLIKNISNFIRVEFPYDYGKANDLITGYPLLNVSFKVKYHKLFEIEPKISFKSFLIYIETGLNFLDIKKPKIEDLKLILTDYDKALMEEKFEQSNIYKPLRELSSKLMGELTNPLATYLSKEE